MHARPHRPLRFLSRPSGVRPVRRGLQEGQEIQPHQKHAQLVRQAEKAIASLDADFLEAVPFRRHSAVGDSGDLLEQPRCERPV